MKNVWKYLVGLFCLTLSLATPGNAQSTFGSIRGTVVDSTGAVVAGAAETLTSVDQGTAKSAVSDSGGAFVFQNLKPGKYVITAAHSGFSTTKLDGIQLDARQDLEEQHVDYAVAAE
jgi:protocatechuate 3,4-dioxygenase beta subunit